ncbi:hypothetical protein [Pumilibacter muris]|uniref:hypothetical protein n=1 Tax=Pumilibacter muris TaxID=2941510 RepID=UPI00203A7D5B|nr:hypothetical protein [Pumilibacter muris]
MPKIAYKQINFRDKSLELIDKVNEIVGEYDAQNYELTLRQLYYQLVARDIIPNNQRSYDNIGALVNNGRLAGLIDWYSISDRTRNLRQRAHWDSPSEIISAAAHQFQIDKWEGQENYVEVWVEKDALVEIVGKAAERWDTPYFSCRGYVSQSEMWAAARRIKRNLEQRGFEKAYIIHLGDHDPSGIDMSRDIIERLTMFSEELRDRIELDRIALNMPQIRKYNPPPNPAKITDSRYGAYVSQHGGKSWELDALDPRVLDDLIDKSIQEHLDKGLYLERERSEKSERDRLLEFARNWED